MFFAVAMKYRGYLVVTSTRRTFRNYEESAPSQDLKQRLITRTTSCHSSQSRGERWKVAP